MKKIIQIFLSILLAQSATALENDKAELIKIQSDTAEFNETTGTALYRGQVVLEQGSLKISSNALTIYNSENGVSKVLAEGSPAHYEQLIDIEKPPVKAQSKKIIYLPQEESISLEGNAKLAQGDNHFEGEHIHYDLKKHILNAKGHIENDDINSSANRRVKMVIPPTKKSVEE